MVRSRLGMSLDELYTLCPRELDAILEVHYRDERELREWERLNTFVIFNAMGGSDEIRTPADLIPFPWDGDDDGTPMEVDWDELDRKYSRG